MKTLLAKLLGISKSLLDWLLPIVQNAVAQEIEVLAPIALNIVTQLATGQLKGKEKQQEAFNQLGAVAAAKGIEVGTNTLNTMIELAVMKLKAQK